jgi:tetratricopeptide (TPR) repeat protein
MQKSRDLGPAALFFLSIGLLLSLSPIAAQQSNSTPAHAAGPGITTDKALALAEQGRCQEAISALKRAMNGQVPPETQKKAGILGLRCSLNVDNRESTIEFIRLLSQHFPKDPDVLFILVHAYSDLSTRTAQDLGRTAPQSIPAHKLNAEALEMQGKWDPAQLEYEEILKQDPNALGIHFLYGRLLLSRPDAGPDSAQRAKQEFQKEIEIDPKNAGAHYVLGELARRDENWEEAIADFSAAAKLDPSFAEAYFAWGFCLVTVKRYEEAVAPLRAAERLAPGNPEVHYNLATALSRSGNKEEADKEFAIHRSLTAPKPTSPAAEKPQ